MYPTRCNVTQFILFGNCSTCFGWYLHPSPGAHTTVSTASGICHTVLLPAAIVEELGLQSQLFHDGRGRAGRPDHDQQHCYHHAPTVKPEAATAVVELLMMGVRTPETC